MKKNLLKRVLIFAMIALTAPFFMQCSTKSGKNGQTGKEKKYRVVGYVAGYRHFDFSKIQPEKLTHINYAFANVINGEVMFDTTSIDNTSMNAGDIIALQGLKKKNPDLKILVSVGGWTWSGNFSDAALTEESRHKFATSAARFVDEYKLDGIDIDWEYPNQVGANNIHRPEDIENFTLLMKACREQLDLMAKEKNNKEGYLLTIATGGDKAYIDNTKLGEVAEYLDFLNIMSYDLAHGNHYNTGHHAALTQSEQDTWNYNNITRTVKMHVDAGVPLDKINLGIPFYGRRWEKVNKENNGLFQKAETTGQIIFYHTLAKNLINKNGYTRYWDKTAQAPYLWNPDSAIFISYEDEESIALKMEFIKKTGLSGAMFWEYSDDYQSKLLDAVNKGLNQ